MGSFFHTKVLCTAFLHLQFGLVTFWQKNIDPKHKKILNNISEDLRSELEEINRKNEHLFII